MKDIACVPLGLLLAVFAAASLAGCDGEPQPPEPEERKQGEKPDSKEPEQPEPGKKPEPPKKEEKSEKKETKPDPAALLDPSHPDANRKAPDEFRVRFDTSKGDFVVEVHRDWAPRGADRFYNLVRIGFYDGCRFFRVLDGFVAQFGIHGDPKVSKAWKDATIPDDPVKQSNQKGRITYAISGPDTRTTQLFINFRDNSRLDRMGFAPFGEVVKGMDVVESLYAGYGEGAPRGRGPDQGRIQAEGNKYLNEHFERLDYIKTARIVK